MDLAAARRKAETALSYEYDNSPKIEWLKDVARELLSALDALGEFKRWGQQVHDALDGRPLPEYPDDAPARIKAALDALEAANKEKTKLLQDVDLALAGYGVAFTKTPVAEVERNRAFEESRLALRRVRDALGPASTGGTP